MISRRTMTLGVLIAPTMLRITPALAQPTQEDDANSFDQLIYPPLEAINKPEKFGYERPKQAEIDRVKKIISETPKGPNALAIARSFTERYTSNDPKVISQWPAPEAWNPLIVEFFNSTTLPVKSDMVSWCAAFANWCIERNNKIGTRSAASQSFIDPKNSKYFKKIDEPDAGDLAVWTCYDANSGKSTGFGHVAFVTGKPTGNTVPTISGNTSADNHYSIIVEKPFSTKDRNVYRTINRAKVLTVMKLNSYLKIV